MMIEVDGDLDYRNRRSIYIAWSQINIPQLDMGKVHRIGPLQNSTQIKVTNYANKLKLKSSSSVLFQNFSAELVQKQQHFSQLCKTHYDQDITFALL